MGRLGRQGMTLEWAMGYKRSWQRDERSLKQLRAFFGRKPLDQIAQVDVQRYKQHRRKSKARGIHQAQRSAVGEPTKGMGAVQETSEG